MIETPWKVGGSFWEFKHKRTQQPAETGVYDGGDLKIPYNMQCDLSVVEWLWTTWHIHSYCKCKVVYMVVLNVEKIITLSGRNGEKLLFSPTTVTHWLQSSADDSEWRDDDVVCVPSGGVGGCISDRKSIKTSSIPATTLPLWLCWISWLQLPLPHPTQLP